MSITEILVGLAILAGLVGIVVPVLPGSTLILAAILIWAVHDGGSTAWVVFAISTTLLVVGAIVKYVVPGRRLKTTGVPGSSIWLGGLLGIVGFFVIPVVGLFVGFVAGIYLAEWRRLGDEPAWPSTKSALRAVGASILIEMAAALLAASVWLTGALLT